MSTEGSKKDWDDEDELDALADDLTAAMEFVERRAEETGPEARRAAHAGDEAGLRELLNSVGVRVATSWINRAIEENDWAWFIGLVRAGYDTRSWGLIDDDSSTPLPVYLAGKNRLDMVGFLLERGEDPNAGDDEGSTALSRAAACGHRQVVERLLAHPSSEGDSLLRAAAGAAENGHAEVYSLLKARLDPNDPQVKECSEYWEEQLRKILTKRAKAEERGGVSQDSATRGMLEAALCGRIPEVARHLADGADANGRDESGDTALSTAAVFGNVPLAEYLLDAGADADAVNLDGSTALLAAIRGDAVDVVRLLLGRKAAVDAQSDDGDTPLRLAASQGLVDIVRLLLDAGARTEDPQEALREAERNFASRGAWTLRDARELVAGMEAVRGQFEVPENPNDLRETLRERPIETDLPTKIRLQARERIRWEDSEYVNEIAASLRDIGFEDAGLFEPERPRCKMWAWCRADTSTFATICEIVRAGVWVEFTCRYSDDTSCCVSNAPTPRWVKHPPYVFRLNHVDKNAAELHDIYIGQRPDRPLVPVHAQDFPQYYCQDYEREMTWRKERGEA